MTRTVVVTGGSKGIGLAVAARFAASGAAVVLTGRSRNTVQAAAELIGARGVVGDASDPADAAALAVQAGPRVDVLVAMAGGNTDLDMNTDPTDLTQVAAGWRANLDANLLSAVLTTTALLPAMPEGAAIVTVGSIGAEYAGSSYGAAKAGLAAWTAGLSARVGSRGITANTVSPGYVAETDFFRGTMTDERRTALVAATHDKRPGHPEDVAALVEFLASPGARHITGQNLHVNGGAHTTR